LKLCTPHIIQKNTFWLSHERIIFWEEEKALILSDLHFAKTGHFRKEGIGVPQNLYKEDLQRLFHAIQFFQPKKLIVVGDLFHSRENKEMNIFLKWRNDISHINIHLVKGNHDILENSWYERSEITVSNEQLSIEQFSFTHDASSINQQQITNNYFFSGHIHPGIKIKNSLQSLHFPCFYFGEKYCVLPAFGKFTGLAMIKPKKGETVYAIVNRSLIKV
jgi:DNA ligase-associated metallophosphoesterase